MAAYLDVNGFSTRTIMPAADVAYLESVAAGFIAARLAVNSSVINGRLGKRYAPFLAPIPEIVLGWLVALTTYDAYLKRGYDPSSEQNGNIKDAYDQALADLKEAADGVDGLFDLPLRDGAAASAVTKGGPFVYSEPSPYDWTDVQAEAIRGR